MKNNPEKQKMKRSIGTQTKVDPNTGQVVDNKVMMDDEGRISFEKNAPIGDKMTTIVEKVVAKDRELLRDKS